jgi:hypothetical protein
MRAVVVMVNIAVASLRLPAKRRRRTSCPKSASPPGSSRVTGAASHDAGSGMSFVVFRTKPDAENAEKMARSGPLAPGVTVTGVEIREVVAEA